MVDEDRLLLNGGVGDAAVGWDLVRGDAEGGEGCYEGFRGHLVDN